MTFGHVHSETVFVTARLQTRGPRAAQSGVWHSQGVTVVLMEEAEEAPGRVLKRSSAECARAGLDTAGLSLLSGTHPPPLDTDTLGAGASNGGQMEASVIT